MKKIIVLAITLAMVGAFALSTTMAYLTGSSGEVKNLFVLGNINIGLKEDNWKEGSKIIPGEVISKKPIVTVNADSEPCYLFVYLENALVVPDGDGYAYVQPDIKSGEGGDWRQLYSKIESSEGIPNYVRKELYLYVGDKAKENIINTSKNDQDCIFFTEVEVPGSFTMDHMKLLQKNIIEKDEEEENNNVISVQAFAHQSANVDLPTAKKAALTQFGLPVPSDT